MQRKGRGEGKKLAAQRKISGIFIIHSSHIIIVIDLHASPSSIILPFVTKTSYIINEMNTLFRKSISLTRRAAASPAFNAYGLPRRQFSVASNLSSLIEREIAEEDPVDELPAGLAELKESLSSKWTIVEGDSTSTDGSGATVKMYKKDPTPTGGKVSVTFVSRSLHELFIFYWLLFLFTGGNEITFIRLFTHIQK